MPSASHRGTGTKAFVSTMLGLAETIIEKENDQ
jgi:hypothetical protein